MYNRSRMRKQRNRAENQNGHSIGIRRDNLLAYYVKHGTGILLHCNANKAPVDCQVYPDAECIAKHNGGRPL